MESISWPSFPIYLNPLSLRFNLSSLVLSFPYSSSSYTSTHISSASKTIASADSFRKPTKRVSEYEQDEEIEDQILEDIAPLARLILHSGKYENGERLSSEHEHNIIQRLLAYHPQMDKKIGCGINYIMVGQHPDFERSRCLFIAVRMEIWSIFRIGNVSRDLS